MGEKIVWTPAAIEDLKGIRDYIARDSEQNAAAAIGRIVDAVDLAADFPMMGTVVSEFSEVTIRELIVYSYRVIYRVRPGQITVHGIIHGARRLKRALKNRRL
jgi:toxin ParE1/3/4